MKSIITTYPDFRSLLKGIKSMLVASESFFFRETKSPMQKLGNSAVTTGSIPNRGTKLGGPLSAFGNVWKN